MEVELLDEIASRHVIKITEEDKDSLCESCHDRGYLLYTVWIDEPRINVITVDLCMGCLKGCLSSEEIAGKLIGRDWAGKMKSASEDLLKDMRKESELAILVDEDELHEELKMREPEFWKALDEWNRRAYTCDDGSEDPLLQSIGEQVLTVRRAPTEKQMIAFRGRVNYYIERKRCGEEMVSPEKLRKRGAEVVDLLIKAMSHRTCSKQNLDRIESVNSFHAERGYITEKQFKMVEGIVNGERRW